MAKRYFVLFALAVGFLSGSGSRMAAQQGGTSFRISVDLVQLNVAVTDRFVLMVTLQVPNPLHAPDQPAK